MMTETELLPATQSEAEGAVAVGSTPLLGRAELPDRFEIIVNDHSLLVATHEEMETSYDQWMAIKWELIRRGYTIWETRDEEHCRYVVTCAKRPNDQALRLEAK